MKNLTAIWFVNVTEFFSFFFHLYQQMKNNWLLGYDIIQEQLCRIKMTFIHMYENKELAQWHDDIKKLLNSYEIEGL